MSVGRAVVSGRPGWSGRGVEDEAVVDGGVEAVGFGLQAVLDGLPVGLGGVCTSLADYHGVQDVSQSWFKA